MFDYFYNHSLETEFMAIFGGMTMLLLLESYIPRQKEPKILLSRWFSNIALALMNYILGIVLSLYVISRISVFNETDASLFAYFIPINTPVIFTIILTLFILEFATYWVHRAYHNIPVLWRMHAVHHIDTDMDVTTSHRHHPFESILSAIILFPIVSFLGAPISALLTYTLLTIIISLISHSNILLPSWLDAGLRRFVVTPDFHRLHHSVDLRYTDSNYGVITPWFDYLFNTSSQVAYKEIPQMKLGLTGQKKPNQLIHLLLLPLTYKKNN